jgi:hypothetical protein
MNKDSGNYTRFPEFAYNWLGQFCVDPKKRIVRQMEFFEQDNAGKIRLNLLLGLKLNSLEKKMWEYQTFVEFLNEKYSVDEIVYFLHVRNLIYNGP